MPHTTWHKPRGEERNLDVHNGIWVENEGAEGLHAVRYNGKSLK
jgi:hypothetical protein